MAIATVLFKITHGLIYFGGKHLVSTQPVTENLKKI